MLDCENYPVIAAVHTEADFEKALDSDIQAVFMLASDIMTLDGFVRRAHEKEKLLFIHMDFVEGLSKDAAGVQYLATKNIDGIISTRSNIIIAAKKRGICCIQRFFMVDSRSVDTAIESLRQTQPDLIEVMPAIAYKSIARIKSRTHTPIIAGGLIETKDEIFSALNAGAEFVSTGAKSLWE